FSPKHSGGRVAVKSYGIAPRIAQVSPTRSARVRRRPAGTRGVFFGDRSSYEDRRSIVDPPANSRTRPNSLSYRGRLPVGRLTERESTRRTATIGPRTVGIARNRIMSHD